MTTAQLPLPHLGPQARLLLDRIIGAGRDGVSRADLVDWVLGRLLKLGYATVHPSDPSAVVQTPAGLRRWQMELLEEERREADKLRRQLTRERVEARFRAMQQGYPMPVGPRPPIVAGLPTPQRPALPPMARAVVPALRHEPVARPPIPLPVARQAVLALPPSLVPRAEPPARLKVERKRRGMRAAAMVAASTGALLLVGAGVHAGLWSRIMELGTQEANSPSPSANAPIAAAAPAAHIQPAIDRMPAHADTVPVHAVSAAPPGPAIERVVAEPAKPQQQDAMPAPQIHAESNRDVVKPEQVTQASAPLPRQVEPAPAPAVVAAATPVPIPILPESALIDPPPAPPQAAPQPAVILPAAAVSTVQDSFHPAVEQAKVSEQQVAEAKPLAPVPEPAAQTASGPHDSAEDPLVSLPESKIALAAKPDPPASPPIDSQAEAKPVAPDTPVETAVAEAAPAPAPVAQLPAVPLAPLSDERQQPVMVAVAEAAPAQVQDAPPAETVAALHDEPETATPDTTADAPPVRERHANPAAIRPAAAAPPAHVRHQPVAAVTPAKPVDPMETDHQRVEHLNELSLAAAKRGVEWRPKG